MAERVRRCYMQSGMNDRLFFAGLSLAAIAMIAFALVWPQGLGARSPAPFGHEPVLQSAAVKAAQARAKEAPPTLSMAPVNIPASAAAPAPAPAKTAPKINP